MSNTISRVLYQMIIYLVLMSPPGSSDLPESTTGRRIASYSVLLRMGFTCALSVTSQAVGSYPAIPPLHGLAMRYISVALSLGSPPPDVIRHPALRSPDFPHLRPFGTCRRDHLCYSFKWYSITLCRCCKPLFPYLKIFLYFSKNMCYTL